MLDRYNKIDGNFGTILGGRKGTGKSMTARIVSEKLMEQGIPTILVTENTPGLPRFLQSIEQPVLILIDEFEKIFHKGDKDAEDEQVQFLSLFDGLVNNHHFYLITINDYDKLNQYFIGRTRSNVTRANGFRTGKIGIHFDICCTCHDHIITNLS